MIFIFKDYVCSHASIVQKKPNDFNVFLVVAMFKICIKVEMQKLHLSETNLC